MDIEWSDEDIAKLQLELLKDALKKVESNKACISTKKESFEWLMKDDHLNPFSALNCARSNGLSIYRIQEQLLSSISSEI